MAHCSASSSYTISANASFSKSNASAVIGEDDQNPNIRNEESDVILCIFFKYGKLAAAYYKINEKTIYISNEIVVEQPEFTSMKSLLRELSPRHIATMGSPTDIFIKKLALAIENKRQLNTTLESDQIILLPNKLSLLDFKEYAFNQCEYRLKSLHLTSEPENLTEEGHNLHLQGLINFQSKICVHVVGMLIRFLEKSWSHITGTDEPLVFQHLYQFSLLDNMYIDPTTFEALQIFQNVSHDSRFKHGNSSTSREGVSLFRLFSQNCRTKIGYNTLKNIMLAPCKNRKILQNRLNFIEFAMDTKNNGFIGNLKDIMRGIEDVNMILNKIFNSKGTRNDWHSLHKTIYQILYFSEVCAPYKRISHLFADLKNATSDNLYGLEKCLITTFDFDDNSKNSRPAIKTGLDSILDKRKLARENIQKDVNTAAHIMVESLPDYIESCQVVYIPNMGYVVAVEKWSDNVDPHELINFGFRYMFEANDALHYKNAVCQELDKNVADIDSTISEHENRIIVRVAGFVNKYTHTIKEPLSIIGMIDCLLAMAKVSSEKGYTKPQFNEDNIIEIQDSRHPLLELATSHFVSNSFYSGGQHTRMKIISGPNASGKSIYLKQISLIVYLAHIGSYLPVSSANICMVHSMHSRIFATESSSLNLSAFMIDLKQMSEALYNAKPSSLVIMDEFGRGTTGTEGKALLAGALMKFLSHGNDCPHVLVSSHLQLNSVLNHEQILYQTMDFTRDPATRNIVFLFKVISGVSKSYAIEVAASVGLPMSIINRANEIYSNWNNVRPLPHLLPPGYIGLETPDNFFTNIEVPDLDDDEDGHYF